MKPTMEDKKYMAENDMRILIDAAKIKSDKSRMDAAMKMVREQRKAMNEITDEKKEEMKHD